MALLNYVQGDLLKAPQDFIGHGCNCLGVMGAGVALAIRNEFPGTFEVYREGLFQCRADGINPLGRVIAHRHPSGKHILHMLTQEAVNPYEQAVSYDAINSAVSRALKYAVEHGNGHLALPKIGAGLGGGSWEIIEAILQDNLKRNRKAEITVYWL